MEPWVVATSLIFVYLLVTIGLGGYLSRASAYSGPRLDPPRGYRAQLYHVTDCPQDPVEDRFIGLDNLLRLMGHEGLKFYQSPNESFLARPGGIVASDDLVVIKINYQWSMRGGTNTDLLRGLVRCIVDHPDTFGGEIVICDRGGFAPVQKSFNVAEGGAGGMLLVNLVPQGLRTDNHFIPSVHLEDTEGAAVKAFMATHTGVTATFTQGVATPVQGDKMATFSSRGGPNQTLGISKPDVTAPGVQILAAHTPLPEDASGGPPGTPHQLEARDALVLDGDAVKFTHLLGTIEVAG